MYKFVLQSIEGIEIFPIISLTIFFVFFVLLIYVVYTMDKSWLNNMASLPLDKKDNNDTATNSNPGEVSNG